MPSNKTQKYQQMNKPRLMITAGVASVVDTSVHLRIDSILPLRTNKPSIYRICNHRYKVTMVVYGGSLKRKCVRGLDDVIRSIL